MIWQALCKGQSWDQCYLQSLFKRIPVYEGKSLVIPGMIFFISHYSFFILNLKLKFLPISDCDGVGLEGVMGTGLCAARNSFSTSTILLGGIILTLIMLIKMMIAIIVNIVIKTIEYEIKFQPWFALKQPFTATKIFESSDPTTSTPTPRWYLMSFVCIATLIKFEM